MSIYEKLKYNFFGRTKINVCLRLMLIKYVYYLEWMLCNHSDNDLLQLHLENYMEKYLWAWATYFEKQRFNTNRMYLWSAKKHEGMSDIH